jgi:hypothetical protein
MAPEMETSTEPEAPAPFDFEKIKSMVERGAALAAAGTLPGTSAFNRQEGLDYHGFVAWRQNHSDGIDSAELDAVQAQAPLDSEVESDEARAARVATEGTPGERDDVRQAREAAAVAPAAPGEPAPPAA